MKSKHEVAAVFYKIAQIGYPKVIFLTQIGYPKVLFNTNRLSKNSF